MYKKISGLVVSLTAVFACAAWAEVPAGYPADYHLDSTSVLQKA